MYTRRVYDIKGHVCTRYRPLLRIVCLFSGHVFRDRFLRYLLACFYCLFFHCTVCCVISTHKITPAERDAVIFVSNQLFTLDCF